MCPSVKFFQPIQSWLSARAFSFEDIYPNVKNGLSPCIKIYLGIQYTSSGSVLLSVSSHLLSLSTFFIRSLVLSSSGHSIRCAAVSRLLQFGHRLSEDTSPEYLLTLTQVPQNLGACLERQTLYMLGLFFRASSRCSQLTSSKRTSDHLSLVRVPR
jgi:hypothetical protein